ncbi:hypothetical protein LSCM1_01837 [Leishmania martiniquensis]|uniref:3'-5' exonuclease domain-containing protein n=1 Tax=Leishmania martiniquensis TaxID=1580590 RepID=A0A836FWH1_9TRYP|nr:hypothetical protein LSCM1_01837 [Leishmania martiniquensis]
MPSAVETGRFTSSLRDVGEKDVDDVTYVSESVCSSSNSADADAQAATSTARAALGAWAESPIVKHRSGSSSCNNHECVSFDLRIPAAEVPCGALEDILVSSAAVSGPTAPVPAPFSSRSTGSAKPTPAPPSPIDFSEAMPAAAGVPGGPARVLAPASGSPPSLLSSSARPEAALALSAATDTASSVPVASLSGSASRLPFSREEAQPCVGPSSPPKLVMSGHAAISSLSSIPPQTQSLSGDYMARERRPSKSESSLCSYEGSNTTSSAHAVQQVVSDTLALPLGGQHLPSTSSPQCSEVTSNTKGSPFKIDWKGTGGSKCCAEDLTNARFYPAGAATSKEWTVAGRGDETHKYSKCVASGLLGGEMSANLASAASSKGVEYSNSLIGIPYCAENRPLSFAPDSGSRSSPPLGLYPSVLPHYSARLVPPTQQIVLPPPYVEFLGTRGGEYEYGDWRPPGGDGAPKYSDNSGMHYCEGVPQEVQCIERLDHLHHICRGLLFESGALGMRREEQQREGVSSCGDDNAEEAHWSRKLTIALDLEGRSLGRKGSICIITLATYTNVYIIDLVLLGAEALRAGSALKSVLESRHIMKLMFDCRADCDALFFLYGVRLQCVCDLQIASCFALFPTARRLPGMKSVFLTLGLFAEEDTAVKNAGRRLFNPCCGGSFDWWEERPLKSLLVQYCAVDVKYFFLAQRMLWCHIEQGCRLGEARLASVCKGNFLGGSTVNSFRDFDIV